MDIPSVPLYSSCIRNSYSVKVLFLQTLFHITSAFFIFLNNVH